MKKIIKKQEFIELEIAGKSIEKWDKLQSKFLQLIEDITDQLTDNEHVSENVKNISLLAAEYIKAKTLKPTLENEKLISEIKLNYAIAKTKIAEAHKHKAELIGIQLENFEKLLKLKRLMNGVGFSIIQDDNTAGIIIKEVGKEIEDQS